MSPSTGYAGTGEYPVSAAHLVPGRDFTGTIHSVFASACNIAVDGLLVTVQDAAQQHSPTSIRVAVAGAGSWSPVARAGDRAVCRAGVLRFGAHALNLRGVPVWAPGLLVHWGQPSLVRRRLTQLAAVRQAHGASGLLDDHPRLRRDVRDVGARVLATTAGEADIVTAVSRLVGAGPGLTPAGDDVLVGLLAALVRGGDSSPRIASVASWVGAAVMRKAFRTTDISRHYLRLAARGHFGEPLSELVDAVVIGADAQVVSDRAGDVLSVGASSGADAALGVLLGLRAVGELHDNQANNLANEKVA